MALLSAAQVQEQLRGLAGWTQAGIPAAED